ncbi:Rap1a/Tai family immunity protein [Pelagibacterium luteolum]|uniref:Rap1a/Tai family immunity protein n=1 Tax=Pelagibacterium luteolum TaxID=440168 RepID=UPI0015A0BE81
MKRRLVFLAAALFSTATHAQFVDGNFLHDLCSRAPQSAQSYAIGVADETFMMQQSVGDDGLPLIPAYICIPAGVSSLQVKDSVCAYLADNPESRHWPAAILTRNALLEAWPCQ